MPRFIKAADIPMKVRKPHLDRYKRQLRDALMDPSLSETRRADIKVKLMTLGLPKSYKGNPGPQPGTSTPEPAPAPTVALELDSSDLSDTTVPKEDSTVADSGVVGDTLEDLLALPKDELLTKAAEEGVEAFKSWNMTKIAQAILDHRAANE